jgi:hypothetical protein
MELPEEHYLRNLVAAVSAAIPVTSRSRVAEMTLDGDDSPSIDLTIGWNPVTGRWDYQTGDNTFVGEAYSYPVWAVETVYPDSDPDQIARSLLSQLADGVDAGLPDGVDV